MLKIIMFIEDELGVQVEDEEMIPENLGLGKPYCRVCWQEEVGKRVLCSTTRSFRFRRSASNVTALITSERAWTC
jgi:hypothetical protein